MPLVIVRALIPPVILGVHPLYADSLIRSVRPLDTYDVPSNTERYSRFTYAETN